MNTDKIRFGIIGTNRISEYLIKGAVHEPRFSLQAVYSRSEERGNWFAGQHNVPHVYTSLQSFAEDSSIDAVYIASPNALHAPQAIFLMQHGKHVLCEKPFASNTREVKAMIETAHRHKVVVMEAMKTTPTPNFQAIADNLHKIGKIRKYIACYCKYSSRYDDYKNGIIQNAFKPELSNGALVDIGVYGIYPMVALFGKPTNIKATGTLMETGVDSLGNIICQYDGMDACILYSKVTDSLLPSEIQGEKGSMIIQQINAIDRVKIVYRDGTEEDLSRAYLKDDLCYELKEFIDTIQNGTINPVVNSHERSLAVMEIMDEARRQIGIKFPADDIL